MRAESHEGSGLKYLTVLPDDYDSERSYPLVVMLHGFGANMQDLAGLAPVINSRGYVYACPNAPIAFDLGLGRASYGWTSPRGEATPEEFQTAESLLGRFLRGSGRAVRSGARAGLATGLFSRRGYDLPLRTLPH